MYCHFKVAYLLMYQNITTVSSPVKILPVVEEVLEKGMKLRLGLRIETEECKAYIVLGRLPLRSALPDTLNAFFTINHGFVPFIVNSHFEYTCANGRAKVISSPLCVFDHYPEYYLVFRVKTTHYFPSFHVSSVSTCKSLPASPRMHFDHHGPLRAHP